MEHDDAVPAARQIVAALAAGEGDQDEARAVLSGSRDDTAAMRATAMALKLDQPPTRGVNGLMVSAKRVETVTGDLWLDEGEPLWRVDIDGFCIDFEHAGAAASVAAAINARIARAASGSAGSDILEEIAMETDAAGIEDVAARLRKAMVA